MNDLRDVRSEQFKVQLNRFKVYQNAEGCHWTFGFGDSGPGLMASFWTPDLVARSEDYEKDFPYKLHKDHTALFPEWYFCFLLKFSERSIFHKHYCSRTAEEFLGLIIGSDIEKNAVLSSINWEFSTAFKSGLAESFLERYKSSQLTREYVENKLVTEFAESASWTDYLFRFNELVTWGIGGTWKPIVQFMMAFDESEDNIWMTVCRLLVRQCKSKETAKRFKELAEIHCASKFPLVSRLQDFYDNLLEENLTHPKKNFQDTISEKISEYESQGTKRPERPKANPNGKKAKNSPGQTPAQLVGKKGKPNANYMPIQNPKIPTPAKVLNSNNAPKPGKAPKSGKGRKQSKSPNQTKNSNPTNNANPMKNANSTKNSKIVPERNEASTHSTRNSYQNASASLDDIADAIASAYGVMNTGVYDIANVNAFGVANEHVDATADKNTSTYNGNNNGTNNGTNYGTNNGTNNGTNTDMNTGLNNATDNVVDTDSYFGADANTNNSTNASSHSDTIINRNANMRPGTNANTHAGIYPSQTTNQTLNESSSQDTSRALVKGVGMGKDRDQSSYASPTSNSNSRFAPGKIHTINSYQGRTPVGPQNSQKPPVGQLPAPNVSQGRTPIHFSRQNNFERPQHYQQSRGGTQEYTQVVRRRPTARERPQVTPPWGSE